MYLKAKQGCLEHVGSVDTDTNSLCLGVWGRLLELSVLAHSLLLLLVQVKALILTSADIIVSLH